MGKKFTCISHIERMLDVEKGKHTRCHKVPEDTVYKSKKVIKDGRVVTEVEKVVCDPRDNFEGYKVSDFSIEMLQATGAIVNLKPVSLDGGSMAMTDAIVANLDSLDSIK